MPDPEKKSTYNEKRKDYFVKYAKQNLKRIPLDVQKEKYEEIKTAAAAAGETVNGYIKKAVDDRIDRESLKGVTV